jgi:hypothetical protein
MLSSLSEAVARCQARRLAKTVAAAPLPSVIVAILVVLAPLAVARVGHAVGHELAAAVGAGAVSTALVVGPALAACVAGAALAVSLQGRSSLGQQVAAGPGGGIAAIAACLLLPALIGVLCVLPSLFAVCVALADELPGGRTAGVALVAATMAAVPAGAIVAEGAMAATRRRRRRSILIAGGALAWAATGAAAGVAALGPLAPVSAALRGSGSAWLGLAAASGTAFALAVVWVLLAGTRPERAVHSVGPTMRLVRGGWFTAPAALAVLLARRDDVRLATIGALGFGAAGVAIAVAAGAPAPTAFMLATTTALLGAILCSLAVCGVLLHGRWLWVGGPVARRVIGLVACLVGLAGSVLPVAVVGAGATAVSGATWSAVGVVTAFVVVGCGAALLAGTLVPWNREAVGDQMTTFAALAAIAIAMSLVVGFIAPRLVSHGVPDAVVVVLFCVASIGGALLAVTRRLGASTR